MSSSFLLGNFYEVLAQVVGFALTDAEKEKVVLEFRNFHKKLQSISSANLAKLAQKEKDGEFIKIKCKHKGRSCTQNAVRGFVKAFVAGLGVKYLLDIVPLLISLKIFKRPGEIFRLFKRDNLQFAAFLSLTIGLYKTLLCFLRSIRSKGSWGGDRLNSFLAGLIAGGVGIQVEKNASRRFTITQYVFTRSLICLIIHLYAKVRKAYIKSRDESTDYEPDEDRVLLNRNSEQEALRFTNINNVRFKVHQDSKLDKVLSALDTFLMNYGPTMLMAVSTSYVAHALLKASHLFPRSYYRFLMTYSGFSTKLPGHLEDIFPLFTKLVDYEYETNSTALTRIPDGMKTYEMFEQHPVASSFADAHDKSLSHDWVQCAILHPYTPHCSVGFVHFLKEVFPKSLLIYLPLNFASAVIFKRKALIVDPVRSSTHILKASLRSSTFFALMVACAGTAPCYLKRILGFEHPSIYYVNGLFAGLSVLVEKPSRRMELGMYVFMRALELFWRKKLHARNAKAFPRLEKILFAVSFANLIMLYQNNTDHVNYTTRSIMTRIFGKN